MLLTINEFIQSIILVFIFVYLTIFIVLFFCQNIDRQHQPNIIYQVPSPLTLYLYRNLIRTIEIQNNLSLDDVIRKLAQFGKKRIVYNLEEGQEECPICLETIPNQEEIYNIPCGHNFHQHCLELNCQINRTCPVCRNHLF